MTRDEAMRLIQMNRIIGASPEMQLLSWVEGLGLLKLDEPKTLEGRTNQALGSAAGWVRENLKSAGLQITENQER